jgi:hypothetical protein
VPTNRFRNLLLDTSMKFPIVRLLRQPHWAIIGRTTASTT